MKKQTKEVVAGLSQLLQHDIHALSLCTRLMQYANMPSELIDDERKGEVEGTMVSLMNELNVNRAYAARFTEVQPRHMNGSYVQTHTRSVLLLTTPGSGVNSLVESLRMIVDSIPNHAPGLRIFHLDDFGYRPVKKGTDGQLRTNIADWRIDIDRLAYHMAEYSVLTSINDQFDTYGYATDQAGTFLHIYIGYLPDEFTLSEITALPWYGIFFHHVPMPFFADRVLDYRTSAHFDRKTDELYNLSDEMVSAFPPSVKFSGHFTKHMSDEAAEALIVQDLYAVHSRYLDLYTLLTRVYASCSTALVFDSSSLDTQSPIVKTLICGTDLIRPQLWVDCKRTAIASAIDFLTTLFQWVIREQEYRTTEINREINREVAE